MTADRRARLLAKLEAKSIPLDGPLSTPCKIWTGPTSGAGRGGGYGRVKIDGGTMAVHIVSFTLAHGPIPPRKQIDHRCNNRLCWAEDHLQMVTHLRNQRLRAARQKAALKLVCVGGRDVA